MFLCPWHLPKRSQQPENQQEKQDTLPDTSQVDIQEEGAYVSVGKYPQKPITTGRQTQLISSKQLSYQLGNTFSELINQTSIHVLGAQSNPATSKDLYTRGAPPRHTLIMMDGIPLLDPSRVSGIIDPRLLSLEGVSAIEIWKGGQTIMYGSNAVTGVINLRSTSPLNGTSGLQGDLSYGSLDTYQGNLNFRGQLGLGPKKGTRIPIGYEVGASWYGSSGLSEADQESESTTRGQGHETDGINRQNYRLALEGKFFSNRLHVRSSFYHSRMDYDFDNGPFQDALNTYANLGYSAFNNILNYQPSPRWRLTLKHSFQHTSRFLHFSSPTKPLPITHLVQFNLLDFYIRYGVADKFWLLMGVDFRAFRNGEQRPNARAKYTNFSAQLEPYAMIHTRPFGSDSPFHLELGARILAAPSYASPEYLPLLAGIIYLLSNPSDESYLPFIQLLSLDFNPYFVFKDKYKLYFSSTRAHIIPNSFQMTHALRSGNSIGEYEWKLYPESVVLFSLGFDKASPSLEKKKRFYMSWRFALFFSIAVGGITREDGTGEQNEDRRKYDSNTESIPQAGIEAEPSFYFGPYWQFDMGYVFSTASTEIVGQVTRLPVHRLRGSLIWKPKHTSLYLRLQSQLVGRRGNPFGEDPPEDEGPPVKMLPRLPGYALVDFYAAYDLKKRYNLRFFVQVQNLLNNRSYREDRGYNTLGIQVRGGLRFSLQ